MYENGLAFSLPVYRTFESLPTPHSKWYHSSWYDIYDITYNFQDRVESMRKS